MTEYSREDLIYLCERAIVPQEHWKDRDSKVAHESVGRAWALLKAGCDFKVITRENVAKFTTYSKPPVTNTKTIWLYIDSHGFLWFENSWDDSSPAPLERDLFYIPTADRLEEANGGDWY